MRLACILKSGDVILLDGPIGSGKSHFARSLILSLLSEPEDVPSPTFTLVQTYEAPDFEIWHSDLYRLTSPDEVVELGLTEAFEEAVCLVEWPDRLADLCPQNGLNISFKQESQEQMRTLQVSWTDTKWNNQLQGIFNA